VRRFLPLVLCALAGCGGDGMPSANGAQPHASAPIGTPDPAPGQDPENISKLVPRGTEARGTEESPPVSSPGVKHAVDDGYRAIGTEPFWAVTVKGSTAVLERPDRAPVRYAISRNDDPRAVRFLGEGFSMTVTEGPCSDGMSDAVWSDRVAVAFGEGTLNGCGGLRDDQGEP
jgi:uncharacterized membrane protein